MYCDHDLKCIIATKLSVKQLFSQNTKMSQLATFYGIIKKILARLGTYRSFGPL